MSHLKEIDKLLEGKTDEEKIRTLRSIFEHHVLEHPWLDNDLHDSILENIANDESLR